MKKFELQELIDIGVEENITPSSYVSCWDQFGDWQLKTLKEEGLKPKHNFLDLGCGGLRLGVQLIPYLESGNYCGIDPIKEYVSFGTRLVKLMGVKKKFNTLVSKTFEFQKFNKKFDYGMAQSVFTFMSHEQIQTCLKALKKVMNPGSKLVFTYIKGGRSKGSLYEGFIPVIRSYVPHTKLWEKWAQAVGARFEDRPDIKHPTQRVAILHF